MKKYFAILFLILAGNTLAQVSPGSPFTGAEASSASYKALFSINDSAENKLEGILRNINNALDDPRLKGKLEVELVAFGDGVELYKRSNPYHTSLLALQRRGVLLVQCENTLAERKIDKKELWPFISYTPSAAGEIIIRQHQGWGILKP